MKLAAYCRVSTDKEDQLNSLEAQKQFFTEYTQRTGDVLVRLYADEGISGTKIKNRKEFLRMMKDAEQGLFDMVVVKDISRFARNTVDLLPVNNQMPSYSYVLLMICCFITFLSACNITFRHAFVKYFIYDFFHKNILYDIANSQLSFISKIITLYQSA